MKLLTPEAQHAEQITNLANVFTRVDRVLAGRGDVKCQAVHSGSKAPAWSDGRTITFNVSRIADITNVEDIVMITGLNYHELAHVLYTPRENTTVGRYVIDYGYQMPFNILEDQRIETLLTAMYPSTASYFTTTFMRYCLAREEQWESNHVLAYGRRYLPRQVRTAFGKRFKWQEHRADFEKVIDEYRLLNPNKKTHAKKMCSLIAKFNRLLQLIKEPDQPYGHGKGERPEVPDAGKEQSANQQDEATEWAEWYDEDRDEKEAEEDAEKQRTDKGRDSTSKDTDEDQEDSDDGEDSGDGAEDDSGDASEGDESGDDSGSDGDPADSGSEDGSAGDGESGDGADGDADSGGASDDAGDSSRGDGADNGQQSDEEGVGDAEGQGGGIGDGKSGADGQRHIDDDNELRGQIEDALNEILNDAEIIREATNRQSQIINGVGDALPQLDTKRASYKTPSPQMSNIATKFGRELERLRADLDPGWHKHQSSGRINIQRAIQGADLDTLWDQWDEGVNDSTDFEAVLYVDYSGSMHRNMDEACSAMWVIKRAIEAVGGTVTVYAFDDESSVLYRPDQKAEADKVKIISADGSTDPTDAIRDSLRIFQSSKRRNMIAIFLTDGGWSGAYANSANPQDRPDEWPGMIDRMNKFGIVTALAVIGGYNQTYDTPESRRQTQYATNINNPGDLIGFAKTLVKMTMKGGRA